MRIFSVLVAAVLVVTCNGGTDRETASGDATEREAAVQEWSTCELLWAKITNADLAGDRERETALKARARELRCFSRPESIEHREYPEAEGRPDP